MLVACCECLEFEIPNMIASGSKNISNLTDLLSHVLIFFQNSFVFSQLIKRCVKVSSQLPQSEQVPEVAIPIYAYKP